MFVQFSCHIGTHTFYLHSVAGPLGADLFSYLSSGEFISCHWYRKNGSLYCTVFYTGIAYSFIQLRTYLHELLRTPPVHFITRKSLFQAHSLLPTYSIFMCPKLKKFLQIFIYRLTVVTHRSKITYVQGAFKSFLLLLK